MGKLIKLIIIFFLCINFVYADFDTEFASISKQMQTSPSKAYTDLQSLYLHLILDGNDAQKIKVLTALIQTSKKLNFDHDRYEQALNELTPKQNQKIKKVTNNTAATIRQTKLSKNTLRITFNKATDVSKSFILQKKKVRYVYDFKAVLPQVSKSFKYANLDIKLSQFDAQTVRLVINSNKKEKITVNKNDKTITFILPKIEQKSDNLSSIQDVSKIKNTSLKNAVLQITFDQYSAYKDFILQKDKIRYVYDFHSVMPTVSKSYTYEDISIKISQFDPQTTRLVVTTSKKLDLKPVNNGNVFVLSLVGEQSMPPLQNNKKFLVVLDPGHGGRDPGAVGYRNYREKVVVSNFTNTVKKHLEKKGIRVLLTRDSDTFIKLGDRTKFANDKDADVFVSIHANAAKSRNLNGIETYFLSPARSERAKRVAAKENKEVMDKMAQWSSKNTFLTLMNREKIIESNKLAIDIQKNMLYNVTRKYKNVRDGGVREAPFWVLVGAQMPSVLIELGYITNAKEAQRLVLKKHQSYQDAIAKGIAEGIINYLSLAKRY